MANRRTSELTMASELTDNDLFLITDTDTGTSQRLTGQQLVDFINNNADIPTTVNDIAGLNNLITALQNKDIDLQGQIDTLDTEVDGKLDSADANIVGNTIYLNGHVLTVPTVTDSGDVIVGGLLPTVSVVGDYLQAADTEGNAEYVGQDAFRTSLGIDQVANLNPIDYPVSTAQQAALDLKRNNSDQIDYDTDISNKPTTISDSQASAITANTAKRSFPAADEAKLDGIEAGADVTDTANVWNSLGISTEGRTTFVLSERGVFVELPASSGNVTQLVTEITTQQTALSSGGGMAQFTVTGVPSTIVNLSFVNTNPANWIGSTAFDNTQVTLSVGGTATVNVTVPAYTLTDGNRSFQVQAQVEGAFQAPVTSEVVTQYTSAAQLTNVSLNVINFGNAGVTETITVTGIQNVNYDLSLVEVTPAGWITSGALSGTTGSLDGNGTDSTNTITIPTAQDDTVNRSFKIRASVTGNAAQFIESAVITQVHTQSTAAGNLQVGADAIYSTPNIDFYTNITQGDAPFEIVLNNHPTDKTVNPLHTLNLTELHETFLIPSDETITYNGTDYLYRIDQGPSLQGGTETRFSFNQLAAKAFGTPPSEFQFDFVIPRVNGVEYDLLTLFHGSGITPSFSGSTITIPSAITIPPEWYSESFEVGTGTGVFVYYGNVSDLIEFEKTSNFEINVGSGEYSFTTDDTGAISSPFAGNPSWQIVQAGPGSSDWRLTIENQSYWTEVGSSVTVSFGGASEICTIEESGSSQWALVTDSTLISNIQGAGVVAFGGAVYEGTSTISFVANPGAPAPPADGNTNYYLHVSDADGDVVVAMETVNIDNQTPSGMIDQTEGATSPAAGSTVELTTTFSDVESNPFNYQWQYQDVWFGPDTGLSPTEYNTNTGVSTWSAGELSSQLGVSVTENSLQGFVVTVFGSVSNILSNTEDTITTDGSAIFAPSAWGFARIYDNNYTNVAGETGYVYEFQWDRFEPSGSLSIASSSYNNVGDIATVTWDISIPGLQGKTYSGTPRIELTDGTDSSGLFDTTAFSYDGSTLTASFDRSDHFLPALTLGQNANESMLADYSVLTNENEGLYRCQVTATQGDTTAVNSNAIELT